MNLELSKKQFLALLKTAYLGDWLANATKTKDFDEDVKGAYKHLLSKASEFGLAKYVQYDEETHAWYPSQKLEFMPGLHELIDDYDEETFWDELIERLADRDFTLNYNRDARRHMSRDEYLHIIYELEDKYAKETEEHGIDRLEFRS